MEPGDKCGEACCGQAQESVVAAPARPVRADSCCGPERQETSFGERAGAGRRRRVLVRRAALAGAGILALAAVSVTAAGGSPVLSGRLAWAASVWAAGLLLGWARDALSARSADWRLALGGAALVAGIVWQPLVPALVAVALLAERVLRAPVPPAREGQPATSAAAAPEAPVRELPVPATPVRLG